MNRPQNLSSGAVAIKLSPLHKAVAKSLTDNGEHYFKGQELMDVFGLAANSLEAQEAISCLLSMVKELRAMDCQLLRVGFREIDQREHSYCFTYCVQSNLHDTDPLDGQGNLQAGGSLPGHRHGDCQNLDTCLQGTPCHRDSQDFKR